MTEERRGERGPSGPAGERGKTGDHGQDGTGIKGDRGETGKMGPAYTSFITRNLARVYIINTLAVILSFLVMGVVFDAIIARVDRVATVNCEAGNDRSNIQKEDLLENIQQTKAVDLKTLFGIDDEQVAEFRRLSEENSLRRIARLPYINCKTGEKVPIPHP